MSNTFTGFTPDTIDFLWHLALNNNRTWFEENKNTYRHTLQDPLKALVEEVHTQVSTAFPKHGFIKKVTRIHRDARRVKDGQPYKTSLWMSIEHPVEEWTSTPVFWFEIGRESYSYGLGYYAAKALTMQKFRARLDRNPAQFEKLIGFLDKQTEFTLSGDEYKRAKTPPTETLAAWYNRKSFSIIHTQPNDAGLYSPDLATRLADGYKSLMPLYDYFITLDHDPDPREV